MRLKLELQTKLRATLNMWPFSKSLDSVLNKTKTVRIFGVKFTLKKVDPTNFLDGSKVMIQLYDTYKVEKNPSEATNNSVMQKVKDHYKDIFMAAVVEPKLRRNEKTADGLLVDNLFTEWDLAHELYGQIMAHTYGKKKLQSLISQKINSYT